VNHIERLEIEDPRWGAFVSAHPEATAFHEPAWAILLAECYGFRSFAIVLTDETGIRAGLPIIEMSHRFSRRRSWASLPFTDACAPLSTSPEAGVELAGKLDELRAEAGVDRLQVRADLELPDAVTTSDSVLNTLDLSADAEAVQAKIHPSQRRNVRHAEREQVEVRVGQEQSDLDRVFYDLQLETRRRLGVPIQPRRFYSLLWQHMLEPGHGFLLLAYAGSTPISGVVILDGHGHLTYKFGASTQSHWGLRANSLLFWSAIERGCETGSTSIDFGRTELRHGGLLNFKRQWTTTETPLPYTLLGTAGASDKGGVAAAAAPLIRHGPLWVCRLLGEAFYRYTA
jgi:CelD/BcsL family acetyltransferase involved in cellulose biosynthesis